jgi:hypothetical protein
VIAALSLATDLGIGVPLEHGLHSTVFAMRLGERLGVDSETASQTYYACLLFYVGCTADAELAAEIFGEDGLTTYATPVRFGSRPQMMGGCCAPWRHRVVRRWCAPGRARGGSRGSPASSSGWWPQSAR